MFSNSTRHILLIVFYLCRQSPDEYRTLERLAEETGISESYVRKIITRFSKTPFIQSQKGPSGGVRLPEHIRDTKIASLLHELDEFTMEHIVEDPNSTLYQHEHAFSDWCMREFQRRILGSMTIAEAAELGETLVEPDEGVTMTNRENFQSLSSIEPPPAQDEPDLSPKNHPE